MFWSGARIAAELQADASIVGAFNLAKIDNAAYTLTLGDEAYISPAEVGTGSNITRLEDSEDILIPPGQFAFLLTAETLHIPKNVLGLINMKSGIKLRGLVNVSGFHVDPGYNGKLVFSVFNAGPRAVTIRRGDDCFLLWFADLSPNPASTDMQADFVKFAKNKKGYDKIASTLVQNIGSNVVSLSYLNDKIDKLTSTSDRLIIFLTLVIAFATSLTVALAVRTLSGV